MSEQFDAYYDWLGISLKDRPPNHYRLLGIDLFESKPDVIARAADQRMAHVRTFRTGKYSAESQKLLREIAAARLCLRIPEKKAVYDEQLRKKIAASSPIPKPLQVTSKAAEAATDLLPFNLPVTAGGQKSAKRKPRQIRFALAVIGTCLALSVGVVTMLWNRAPEPETKVAQETIDPPKLPPPNSEAKTRPKPQVESEHELVRPRPKVVEQPKAADPKPATRHEPTPKPQSEPLPEKELVTLDDVAQQETLANIGKTPAESKRRALQLLRDAEMVSGTDDRLQLLTEARSALETTKPKLNDLYVKFRDRKATLPPYPRVAASQKESPSDGERELLTEYNEVQENILAACFERALTDYYIAQTYSDINDLARNRNLAAAAKAFDAVFQEDRSGKIGFFAHMWQGRALEDLGDLDTALDIYDEVLVRQPDLRDPDIDPTMQAIFTSVERFKLGIIAKRKPDEYVEQAKTWLNGYNAKLRSTDGYGVIAMDLATFLLAAVEKDGGDNRLLADAKAVCQEMAKTPGPHQDAFRKMIREKFAGANEKLSGSESDPGEDKTPSLGQAESENTKPKSNAPGFSKLGGVAVDLEIPTLGGIGGFDIKAISLKGVSTITDGKHGVGFGGRGHASRRAMVGMFGGTPESERAVAGALNWLARHQMPEGNWSIPNFSKRCGIGGPCTGPGAANQDTGATAMALLPFLAAGQTHASKGPYQKNINSGVYWLRKQQKSDGDLRGAGGSMYSHGLATIALCEAYGMSGDKSIGVSAQKAVNFLQMAQNTTTGGWRYAPGDAGDTSVVGWQLRALKSAQMANLTVNPATYEKAKVWLKLCAKGYNGDRFSYEPGGDATPAMSSVGLLCEQYLDAKRAEPKMTGGATYLMSNLPDMSAHNTYYWYYATQVMHNISGMQWDTWNRKMRKLLIQQQDKNGCAAGSWNPKGDAWGSPGGRVMMTALSALTLEVYYRYPSAYYQSAVDKSDAQPSGKAGQSDSIRPALPKDDRPNGDPKANPPVESRKEDASIGELTRQEDLKSDPKKPTKPGPKQPPRAELKQPVKLEPAKKSNAFQGVADAVDLPKVPRDATGDGRIGEPATLGTVSLEPNTLLGIELIGGKTAVKGNIQFDIEPRTDGKNQSWVIHCEAKEPVADSVNRTDIGEVTLATDKLLFQWLAGAGKVEAANLHNCGLKLSVSGASKWLSLSRPASLEALVLDLDRGVRSVKIPLEAMGDPSQLRLQVTGVEGVPKSEYSPGDTMNLQATDKEKPILWIGFDHEKTKIALELKCNLKATSADVTLRAFAAMPDQPPILLSTKSIAGAFGGVQARLQQMEATLKAPVPPNIPDEAKKRWEEGKKNLEAQKNALAGVAPKMQAIEAVRQKLHNAVKIHFRVYLVCDSEKIDLAISQAAVVAGGAFDTGKKGPFGDVSAPLGQDGGRAPSKKKF